MTIPTFEDYLQDVHSDGYMGTDDDMPENFLKWCDDLDVSEVMDYAQQYGSLMFEKGQRDSKEKEQILEFTVQKSFIASRGDKLEFTIKGDKVTDMDWLQQLT
jgi:hypothetical protein